VGDAAEFTIGADVVCSDGGCGRLGRVVVDPVGRVLTHLVVEPKPGRGLGKLVPTDLVESSEQTIRLRCSLADFYTLEDAEETHFRPEAGALLGYGSEDVIAWPHYGLGPAGMGMGMGGMPQAYTYDRVPAGEVDVRRGDPVRATDGEIGRVQGLVIDPADNHVTHLLLDEGHLWGKKRVTIPIGAVTEVEADGVRVSLTKDEVRELPPIDLAEGD
jgi:sporulation protein YlmC with PRC-barrel domain